MERDRPQLPSGYGIKPPDEGRLIEWSWVDSQVRAARNYWVITASRAGEPHAAPVWGVWHADRVYFSTDPESKKASNLLQNKQVVVHLESGDEVVIIEGKGHQVTSEDLIETIDAAYLEKYGIHITGGPIFEITPTKVLGWSERDYPESATRWTLKE